MPLTAGYCHLFQITIKKAYSYQAEGKERGREAVSPPASGDRLCLWDDRQLCKAPVSGYERDYLRQRHQ